MGRKAILHAMQFIRSRSDFSVGKLCLLGLFIVFCAAMGVSEYLETAILVPGIHLEKLYTFKMIGYANLLLIVSTVLYVWHLWFGSDAVGRWASRLAMVSAMGLVLTLLVRWFETYYLHRPGHVPLNALYEMMALFSTVTIVTYLVMERVYRTRTAGAFVMIIVLGSVLFQIWLLASGQAIGGSRIPLLRSYWIYAHVLANFLGYGAFAVAAAMGAAYLVRSQIDALPLPRRRMGQGFSVDVLPDLQRIGDSMHQAILLGFPLHTIATVLGGIAAYQAWGHYWAWEPKETWSLMVWLAYASYFYFRYVVRWTGRRMAWWAIAGFGMTVFCFLGVRALWPGLHSYV